MSFCPAMVMSSPFERVKAGKPPARFVPLPEHDLLAGAVLHLPVADPPLRGAPDIRIGIRVTPHQRLIHAHGAQIRAILEHRRHLLLPDPGRRTPPDAVAGGCAMPALADAVSTECDLPNP